MKYNELENRYTVDAPSNGGSTSVNFSLGDAYRDANPTIYWINKEITKGPKEHFTLYENGLAIFIRQTASEIELFSNASFNLEDDGNFHLVSFEV